MLGPIWPKLIALILPNYLAFSNIFAQHCCSRDNKIFLKSLHVNYVFGYTLRLKYMAIAIPYINMYIFFATTSRNHYYQYITTATTTTTITIKPNEFRLQLMSLRIKKFIWGIFIFSTKDLHTFRLPLPFPFAFAIGTESEPYGINK